MDGCNNNPEEVGTLGHLLVTVSSFLPSVISWCPSGSTAGKEKEGLTAGQGSLASRRLSLFPFPSFYRYPPSSGSRVPGGRDRLYGRQGRITARKG